MRTEAIYGSLPIDLGKIDLNPTEMLFWLYCPIKLPGQAAVTIPDNLAQFEKIVRKVAFDCAPRWIESYVYLTAKTMFTSKDVPGNRPGWHSDGFLTNDLNYVWCDSKPTVFWHRDDLVSFEADHGRSLSEMDALAESDTENHVRYPVKHLLRLDQTVLHKVDLNVDAGVRSFVKISVSDKPYALKGNSINHDLGASWDLQERESDRNCPIGKAA